MFETNIRSIKKIPPPQLFIWFLFYFFIFLFLLYNSFNYLDPDLGWHLRVGEQIVKEKSVPTVEYYNYTLNEKTWLDHEWLLNATTFWLYNNFGYIAVNIIFALLIVLILIILNLYIIKNFLYNKQGIIYIFIFQLLGLLAMQSHLGVRMQEFTLFYLLLLLIIIHSYLKNKKTAVLWLLLPLFYIWANTHGSFIVGIIIFLLLSIVKYLEIINKKYNLIHNINFAYSLSPRQLLIFLFFCVLALTTTIFTPYGLKLYSFLSTYTNSFYLDHILEWLPAYSFPFLYYQLIYTALVATILLLLVLFLKTKKRNKEILSINLWQIIITITFLLFAFKSRRHFPLFFIASFPLLIYYTSKHLILPKEKIKLFRNNIILYIFLVSTLLLASFYFFINTNFTNDPFNSPHFCKRYPCAALEYLKTKPEYLETKIFNHYSWGGYLLWQWPEKKLFIDGRFPQYKFAGHTLLEEYYKFYTKDKLADKLDQYDIRLILLPLEKKIEINWFDKYFFGHNEQKINPKNYLKEYLKKSNKWHKVYNDSSSVVYTKI